MSRLNIPPRHVPRHVIVIGAGILGASIAWRIAARGVRVTVIDRGEPGSGASSHSFCLDQCRGQGTHRLPQSEPPVAGDVAAFRRGGGSPRRRR